MIIWYSYTYETSNVESTSLKRSNYYSSIHCSLPHHWHLAGWRAALASFIGVWNAMECYGMHLATRKQQITTDGQEFVSNSLGLSVLCSFPALVLRAPYRGVRWKRRGLELGYNDVGKKYLPIHMFFRGGCIPTEWCEVWGEAILSQCYVGCSGSYH